MATNHTATSSTALASGERIDLTPGCSLEYRTAHALMPGDRILWTTSSGAYLRNVVQGKPWSTGQGYSDIAYTTDLGGRGTMSVRTGTLVLVVVDTSEVSE